jgi:hypothetical protein
MISIDPFLINNFDAEFKQNKLILYFENGVEVVPHKIELCENCDGEGRHLRESLRNIAFSSEDENYDPDFMDEMREGNYDQRCNICNGQGRLIVIDGELCNKEILNEIELTLQSIYEMNQEYEMERRMGC